MAPNIQSTIYMINCTRGVMQTVQQNVIPRLHEEYGCYS